MPSQNTIPSTPDPTYVAIVLAVVRGVIQIATGFGFTWALTVSGDQMTMIATAIVMLATLIWSAWQKFSDARAGHANSVASAELGTPVKISS